MTPATRMSRDWMGLRAKRKGSLNSSTHYALLEASRSGTFGETYSSGQDNGGVLRRRQREFTMRGTCRLTIGEAIRYGERSALFSLSNPAAEPNVDTNLANDTLHHISTANNRARSQDLVDTPADPS
jgi:hypothetical protein